MRVKDMLYCGLFSSLFVGSAGCAVTKPIPSLADYLKSKGVDTSTTLHLPEKSALKKTPWISEQTNDVGATLEKLVKELNPEIVAFGELPAPIWVSAHSTAYHFRRDILPAMKRCGFNDLVVAYINQDTADEDLERARRDKKIVAQANLDLIRFKAHDIMKGCRESGVKIHRGGFMPNLETGYLLTLENYQAYGKADPMTSYNDYFIDIMGDIRSNSERAIVDLMAARKKVMWYGPHDFVSLEDKALHAAAVPGLPLEQERYRAVHNAAAFAKEFRKHGFGKKYMSVYVVVPDFIDDDGRLTTPDLRMCWDKKLQDTAQILYQQVEDCYNVMVIYPFENARSGASLKDKIMRNSDDEEILLEPEIPKEK